MNDFNYQYQGQPRNLFDGLPPAKKARANELLDHIRANASCNMNEDGRPCGTCSRDTTECFGHLLEMVADLQGAREQAEAILYMLKYDVLGDNWEADRPPSLWLEDDEEGGGH